MDTTYHLASLPSFLVVIGVLFLGRLISKFIKPLQTFSIPEPIIGGLVVAVVVTVLRNHGVLIEFDLPLQEVLMLMFFTTVGLAANYKMLAKGGAKVFIFLGLASVFLMAQNFVGISMATLLGLEPIMGLIAGSVSLAGGHGTGAAWAQIFSEQYNINALEFAMAAATFGLVMGGIIGGPVGQRLVKRHKLKSSYGEARNHHIEYPDIVTYDQREEERVNATNLVEIFFILLACIYGARELGALVSTLEISWLSIPTFVYALFLGVLLSNVFEVTKIYKLNSEGIDIIGTVSLALFLAMALMSLKLWEIFDLAIPLLVILLSQTLLTVLFALFVTFKVMGRDYDAAVISSGQCGFGMGATPTAVMNMGALVSRHGPSPQAFLVVPMVGAFFLDIVNMIVLQIYIGVIG